ncbi:MAG: hypothetical protein ACE5GC_08755, partial [Acidimicrobiia bacterium]
GVLELGADAQVTAADITADGGIVALRGYTQVWVWVRDDVDIATSLRAEPCLAPSPDEVQGEALAFGGDGGYYTVSEGTNAAISYVAP